MYVVWVTPLSSKVRLHTLTYYTADALPLGSIIDVPVRTKTVPALVMHRESVADVKSFLRRAGFSAKRVSDTQPRAFLSEPLMRALEYTARFHASSLGSTVRTAVPHALLSHTSELQLPAHTQKDSYEAYALQMPYEERLDAYKTIIRETFALKQSVVLIAPTAREVHTLVATLSPGIHKKVYTLTLTESPKEQRILSLHASSAEGPVLICTTPGASMLPRPDIGLYIVERTSSQSYKRRQHPFVDMRVCINALAKETGTHILYGDTFLPLEQHKGLAHGVITEYDTVPKRINGNGAIRVIDMKVSHTDADPTEKSFIFFAPSVDVALHDAVSKRTRVFVLATRRGYAGATVCDDCGTTVSCTRCGHSVTLHTKKNERMFLCHRCGESRSAKERCAHCNGWRLTPLGRGIERVEQELKKKFPDAPLFRIDTDTSPKEVQAFSQAWHEDGGIMVGTERALSAVDYADLSICASLDSLLSIPDFSIDERVFGLIMLLRERTHGDVFIQTQQPHAPVLKEASSGNSAQFVRNELSLREQLHYPPYTVIIKFTCTGNKTTVTTQMQSFAIALARHRPRIFGAFVPKGPHVSLSALIRIKRDAWPKKDIVEYARSLPPSWTVEVLPNRTDS